MGIPGLNVDLDTKVNTSYVNNGLENSILQQTFGDSLNVSLMLCSHHHLDACRGPPLLPVSYTHLTLPTN